MLPQREDRTSQIDGTVDGPVTGRVTRSRASLARPRGAIAALMLALFTAACDVDSLLDVELPGVVPADALDNPSLIATLVESVISDFECAWDGYAAAAAVHSDEFIGASGNLLNKQWGTRQITSSNGNLATGGCGGTYGTYAPLHTARFQAEDVFRRLGTVDATAVPDKVEFQATVRAYGAYALVGLGEGFCEMAIDGGSLIQPAQVLDSAQAKFTEAIEFATEAGTSEILNLARAGRARVRLDREDFAGAIADAELIPSAFTAVATRDGSDSRRYNRHFEAVNDPNADRHASIADDYRDVRFKGIKDPRIVASFSGLNSFDNVTPHWSHTKTTGRDTGVPLASYKEAQLIIAEASARSGDLGRARQILAARHTAVGLPQYDAAELATEEQVIRVVIEERRRDLFVEGAWRLNDMLRFRGTPYEIPFLGEPGSIHPDGFDQTGQRYGTTTCLPLPDAERFGNPNIS